MFFLKWLESPKLAFHIIIRPTRKPKSDGIPTQEGWLIGPFPLLSPCSWWWTTWFWQIFPIYAHNSWTPQFMRTPMFTSKPGLCLLRCQRGRFSPFLSSVNPVWISLVSMLHFISHFLYQTHDSDQTMTILKLRKLFQKWQFFSQIS